MVGLTAHPTLLGGAATAHRPIVQVRPLSTERASDLLEGTQQESGRAGNGTALPRAVSPFLITPESVPCRPGTACLDPTRCVCDRTSATGQSAVPLQRTVSGPNCSGFRNHMVLGQSRPRPSRGSPHCSFQASAPLVRPSLQASDLPGVARYGGRAPSSQLWLRIHGTVFLFFASNSLPSLQSFVVFFF